MVRRARLFDQLDRGEAARLTLVVGSPGSGKSALVADWLAFRSDRSVAWLSCDLADADPVRFVAAVIEALRRAAPQPDAFGADARQLLDLDGQVSTDVIAALVDDLERPEGDGVLVIDDFHLTGKGGSDALALLVEYCPTALQIVVASRVDPALRLHRMRANDELVELRDQDLCFTPEEAERFLSGFGVRLSEPDAVLILQRSEGWVAGLQMAALSIQRSPDPIGAAARVELHRRTVAGYFLDEVVYRQPAEVAEFMLAISVLTELSAEACTALCGEGSTTRLEELYRSHMFVAAVDDGAETYRYHQLIREVLQAELHARDPMLERSLHQRAARYLAATGQVSLAAGHLLAAGDSADAFALLRERVIRDFSARPTVGSALDLDDVQPDLFVGAPEILLPLAAELLLRGAFERGSRAFALAQEAGVDTKRHPDLAVGLAIVSSLHAALIGELEESLAHRHLARQDGAGAVGVDDWFIAVDAVAMYCYNLLGQFEEARQLARAVIAANMGPPVSEVLCPGVMSQVALFEGALSEASALAEGALTCARRLAVDRHYFAAAAQRTVGLLAIERGDLETAAEVTERILDMLGGGRPVFDYLAQLDRARIWAAGGDLDAALASLTPARAALRSDHSVLLAQADELEARFRLALGDPIGASGIAARLPDDRRIVISTIIALAEQDPARAAAALGHAPAQGSTIRSDLELRLLRSAVAIVAASPAATRLVRDALTIVDRHGYIQTVLDTAPQVVDHLLSESTPYPATPNYAALIAAGVKARRLRPTRSEPGRLPDPLTEAEIRVLERLSQRLTYSDMAASLHLSLNTVKTHLRHTYMKLGVTSRSAAVRRATSLGLI